MNRRSVLTGLIITAPMIVKPFNIMPIFSIDDWDPYVLAVKVQNTGRSTYIESSHSNLNYAANCFPELINSNLNQRMSFMNRLCGEYGYGRCYEIVRKRETSKLWMATDYNSFVLTQPLSTLSGRIYSNESEKV